MHRLGNGLGSIVLAAATLASQAAVGGVLGEARYSPEAEHQLQNSAPAGAATWQYAQPIATPAAAQSSAWHLPVAALPGNGGPVQPTSTLYAQPPSTRRLFGYATELDPLYEQPTRPAWDEQHVEWPDYDRPAYDEPAYEMPVYELEPAIKPLYEKPLYLMPNDDKPNYSLKNYEGPAAIAPTMPQPVMRGPNYVIKPEVAPAYNPPIYDNPRWDRPEYLPPEYVPQEYAPPSDVPPPYIGPPK
jgi:hypothetical protein